MTLEDVFLSAVQKDTPAERAAYLNDACGDDTSLRAAVEGLLRSHEQEGNLLDQPLYDTPPANGFGLGHGRPGETIGPYKLLEPIGEGGMGAVWLAEQHEPVRRKVALKLLKAGLGTGQAVARFEAERQTLALMDHPNIAKVHDGGATQAGLPYLVMELVKGVPITKYCDEQRLTPRQRLELFVPVCQAIQHAHQKGVIHRDVKPSNILVALYDDKPVPKVIDFGVAKATGQRLTVQTLETGVGQVVGTIEYMSPEQASFDQLDVDTRTDVYSLGVLLYELLTGSLPFSRKEMETGGLLETLRVIREQEPPRPSTRLSTAEGLPSLAANRGTEPARLARLVRGELDWIVMKALEKDRNRRYDTASAFAEDVQRYLHDQPVKACPPSRSYRFRKFARRNKAALAAGALAGVMLVAMVVILSVSTVLIAKERNEAQEAARRAKEESAKAERERKRADANFAKARRKIYTVNQYLADELWCIPHAERIRRSLLYNALADYKGFLEEGVDDPGVRLETARAYIRVANINAHLGEKSQIEKPLMEALGLLNQLIQEYPREAEYREELADCYSSLSSCDGEPHQSEKGLSARQKQLALCEELVAEHPESFKFRGLLTSCLGDYGGRLSAESKPREAEAAFLRGFQVHDKARSDFPKEPENLMDLAGLHRGYGRLLSQTARHPEAEKHLRQALYLFEALVAKAPSPERDYNYGNPLGWTKGDLARLLNKTGRPEEAEKHLRELTGKLAKMVTDFPFTVGYREDLARYQEQWGLTLFCLNRTQEAEQALRASLETNSQLHKHGKEANLEHAKNLAWSHFHLGELLQAIGRPVEATEQFRQARSLFEKNAERSPDNPRSHFHLVWVLALCPDPMLRDPGRAVRHAKRALEHRPETGIYWTCQGIAQYRAGQWQAAADACEKAMRLNPDFSGFEWFFLAMAQWQLGQKDQARQSFANGVKWLKQRPILELEMRSCRREAAALLGIDDKESSAVGNKR